MPSDDEGVQDLVKIIAGALDLSPGRISFVHRRLTINIDDMSLWFRMDKKCKAVEWRVVDADAETSERGSFKVSPGMNLDSGVVMKMTHLFSAAGHFGPLVATFTGLSTTEMPLSKYPSGVLYIKLVGFSPAAVTNPNLEGTEHGWIVLMRSKTSKGEPTGVIHFMEYNQRVTVPFIDDERVREGWARGTPYREEDTARVSTDGHSEQWNATTDPDALAEDERRKIVRAKCAAAATSQQNACDKGPAHRSIKQVERKTDSKVTFHLEQLEARIAEYIRNETYVNIEPRKLKFICSAIAATPTIYSEAVKARNIADAFVSTEETNESTRSAPSLTGFIGAFPLPPPAWIVDMIKDPKHSKDFYMATVEQGSIPEEMFDEKGVPVDLDEDGNEVEKTPRMTQLNHWRAIAVTGGMKKRMNKLRQEISEEKARKTAKEENKTEVRKLEGITRSQ